VYDTRTGQVALTIRGKGKVRPLGFSPDGAWIVVHPDAVGGKESVRYHDARTGREVLTVTGRPIRFERLFSPDGSRLVLHGPGGVLRICDARTGNELRSIPLLAGFAATGFSPDGARVTATGQVFRDPQEGVVQFYDAASGRPTFSVKGASSLHTPAFSPDGSWVAGIDYRGTVRVADARTGQEVYVLKGGLDRFFNPVFSPDGSRMAAVGIDGTVRVFDARTGRAAFTIRGAARLRSPVFSPDGERIVAVADKDQRQEPSVWVFDARTGQEVLALRTPSGQPTSVQFNRDGSRLAVSLWWGLVVIWEAPQPGEDAPRQRRERLAAGRASWHSVEAARARARNDAFATTFHLGCLMAQPNGGLPAKGRKAR
jgi:WD40 repeat protein